MAYWLYSYNHKANRDEEILGTSKNINTIQSCIDISDCKTAEEIIAVNLDDKQLGLLLDYVLCG